MPDIKKTWREINAKHADLEKAHPEGCVFITSEENSEKNSVAGQTMQVTLFEAAKQLVARTAHISSDAEIAAFRDVGRKFSEAIQKTEMDRNQMAPVIKALMQGQAQQLKK